MNSEEVISQLCDVIGTDSIITDNKEREYFSMDVFDIDEVADLVIQPSSKDQISDALKNYQNLIMRLSQGVAVCHIQEVIRLQPKDLQLLIHPC